MSRAQLDLALNAPMSLPRVERELLIYLACRAGDDGTCSQPISPEEMVAAVYVNHVGVDWALGALMSRGLVTQYGSGGYQLHLQARA